MGPLRTTIVMLALAAGMLAAPVLAGATTACGVYCPSEVPEPRDSKSPSSGASDRGGQGSGAASASTSGGGAISGATADAWAGVRNVTGEGARQGGGKQGPKGGGKQTLKVAKQNADESAPMSDQERERGFAPRTAGADGEGMGLLFPLALIGIALAGGAAAMRRHRQLPK